MPGSHRLSSSATNKVSQLSVLIVKGSPEAADQLVQLLAPEDHRLTYRIVHTSKDMLDALSHESFDVILTDWQLPDRNGFRPIDIYRQSQQIAPLIVCSDTNDEHEAVEALQAGVHDYVEKDRLHLLMPLVERALRNSESRRAAQTTQQELDKIYGELERRIEARTHDIQALNERLQEEIRERRRTEEQLRLAIAGSEGTIWSISFDENTPWVVPEHTPIPARQKQMLGFEDDEFPNSFSAWQARIHPHDLPRVRQEMQDLFDGAIGFSTIEYRILHRDGTYRWLQLRGSLLRDHHGQPVEWNRIVWDITARKSVEQSLLEQKDQLLLAIEGSEGMIWSVDVDPHDPQGWSDNIRLDPRMKQFLGFAPEEFPDSRRAWDARIPVEYREHVQRAMTAHAIGDADRYMVEYPIEHRDGHFVWASVRGRVIRDSQGMPLRMIGMMWDITDRKQYEQQLAESEARFRLLFEAAPDGVLIHQDGRIQFANQAFVTMMHAHSASQLIGMSIWELIRPDFHTVVKERVAAVNAGEGVPPLEEVWTTLDGSEIPVEVTGSALAWRGRPAYQAVLRDITYRRQAEQAIRDSQQKLERAAVMTQLGHWEGDADGTEILISPEMAQILGIEPSDRISREQFAQLVHPEDRPLVKQTILTALRDSKPYEIEFRIVRSDGAERTVHIRGEYPRDKAGRPLRSFGAMQDVTTQRLQERALRESEERLGLAIEGTGLATWDVDLMTGDTVWSDGFYRMLGYNPAMTLPSYEKWAKALHPDDRDRVLETIQQARDSQNSYTTEYRVIQYGTSQIRWQQATGRFLYNQRNEAVRFLGVALDTTERKRNEDALAQSEARLRATIQSIPDEIWIVDSQGHIELVNNAVTENLGVSPERWSDIFAAIAELEIFLPDGTPRPKDQAPLARALRGEVLSTEQELIRHRITGELRTREVTAGPIRSTAGRIIGAVVVARDVTERRHVEETLLQNEERLRAMFDNAGVGIVEVDTQDDRIIAANQRLSEILDRPRQELLGMSIHDLTHPDDREQSHERNAELHTGHAPQISYEKRYLKGDGSPVWVHATVSAIRDQHDRWLRSIATIEDITERKEAEEALRRSQALMAEAEHLSRTGAWEWDLRTNQWIFSDEWLATHGIQESSLSQQELLSIAHPEDRPAIQQAFVDVSAGRKSYDLEHRIIRQDTGEIRTIRAAGRYVRDDSGHLIRVYGFAQDITERKKAEEALRQNEERLRVAVEAANLGTWDLDLVNDTAVRSLRHDQIWGYQEAQQEWGLEKAMRYVIPEDRSLIQAAYAHGMETGVLSHENRIVWPDGSLHWIEAYGRFSYDTAGRPIRVTGVVADITDRKRAEEAVRESEEKFRAIFEQAAIGIGRVRFDSAQWVDVNDTFCRMLGYTREEMLTIPWPQMTHPEDVDLDLVPFRRMAEGELDNYVVEKRFIHKDGDVIWARLTLSLVRDFQGRPLYEIAVIEDISARKRAEEALRESEDRFTVAFKASPDGLVISELDTGLMLEVNDAWVQQWGFSREETIGRRSAEIGILDNLADREHLVQTLRTQGRARRLELPFRRKSGELRYAELSAEILHVNGRNLMLTIVHDITERKQAEQALREAHARIDEILASIREVFYMLDSEWRFVYANEQTLKVWNKTREELVGKTIWEIFPEAFNSHAGQELRRAMTERVAVNYETHSPILHRWIHVQVFPTESGGVTVYFIDITERKRAEEQLAASTERYRRLVDSSPHGIFVHIDGNITYANPAAVKHLGYSDAGELIGRRWQDIVAPEDREHTDRLLALYTGEATSVSSVDLRLQRADGSIMDAEVTASSFEMNGRLAIQEIIHDISDLRQLMTELSDAQERVRLTVAASNISLWQADENLRYVWVYSPQTLESAESVIGKTDQDILPIGDDAERMAALKRRCLETGQPLRQELMLHRPDGTTIWLELTVEPWRDETGTIIGVNGASINISERKRAAEELLLAHERLQRFVDANIVGIVIGSADGILSEANDYFLNLIDYSREELQSGRIKWSAITPEEYLQVDRKAVEELKTTGACTPYEKEYVRRDGSRVPVLVADALLPGPEAQVVGFVLDITDRKRFEQELQKAHDELEHRVFERTGELIEANKLLVREVEERSQAEQKLRHATEQLEQERATLERKNIALKEILGQIDSEKAALKNQLSSNVEQVILPTLRRLKDAPKSTADRLLNILEQDLQTITAPFVDTLRSGFDKLSPREMEVCRLIKNGLSTKEMAEVLNLSPMTIQKHREIIRKKLGLTGGDVNLRSFLQSLSDESTDIR